MKYLLVLAIVLSTVCLSYQAKVVFYTDIKSEIINFLARAESYVLMSSLAVNDPDVLDVLKHLEDEGIVVKIASEYPVPGFENRVDSNSKALLHAKFIVIDGEHVVFGSSNFTESGLEKDLNDMIVFEDEDVAKFFEDLFSSVWNGFPNTGYAHTRFGDFYASPFVDLEKIVSDAISSAKERIDMAIFAFTDMNVLSLLKYMTYKGVKVRIIADDWCKDNESFMDFPTDQFELKVLKNLHHKFMIIDGKTLITGSANVTESGFHRNFEVIYITKDEDIVRSYVEYFEKLWNQPLTAP